MHGLQYLLYQRAKVVSSWNVNSVSLDYKKRTENWKKKMYIIESTVVLAQKHNSIRSVHFVLIVVTVANTGFTGK